MGIASAIKATRMAGGKISSQSYAEIALQLWRDFNAAKARGDNAIAAELEAEFNEITKFYQAEFE